MELQQQLNGLWSGIVSHYRFDVLARVIVFDVTVVEGGAETHHELEFARVASFYFVNDVGEARFRTIEPEEGDILELTSVHYVFAKPGAAKVELSASGWGAEIPSTPNFAVELWSSWLLIEAYKVRLDGQNFDLPRQADPLSSQE